MQNSNVVEAASEYTPLEFNKLREEAGITLLP
jgi:hypothetical protein